MANSFRNQGAAAANRAIGVCEGQASLRKQTRVALTRRFWLARKPTSLPMDPSFLFAFLLVIIQTVSALDNDLALTPPMGWLNWERFMCQTDCDTYPDTCINEKLYVDMAYILNDQGYKRLGYNHVNIDDCWSLKERDISTGELVADPDRFPNGISGLAEKIHNERLKLGLYGDCGLKTCGGYPGQIASEENMEENNFFELDIETFVKWKIDSFKFDGCYIDPIKAESVCARFGRLLKRRTKKILLSCEWPFYMMYAHARPNFTIAAESCNLWRYYDDIEDSWLSITNTIDYSVKHQSTIVKYHGPGHWFDPDQLVIGNFGLSHQQERAQMALWCMWSAPLYMSNDLRSISPESAKILKNEHLIKVNQDRFGVWALMVAQNRDSTFQAFVKPIEPVKNDCPSFAIVYLNRKTLGNTEKVSFKLRDLLLGAPIFEASRNEQEFNAKHGQRHKKLSFDAGKCFELLKRAETEPSLLRASGKRADESPAFGQQEASNSSQAMRTSAWLDSDLVSMEGSRMEFKYFDLFDDAKELGQISINSDLGLMVDPNSVRMVRLEQV